MRIGPVEIKWHGFTDLDADEKRFCRDGNPIEAIKHYRTRKGTSLVEAKDHVQAWRKTVGLID